MKTLILLLLALVPLHAGTGDQIVTAARKQIGVTTAYVPDYVSLVFPNGDVPRTGGVCTDVVIRALRDGLSQDLQQLVNADMRGNFSAYPKDWGLSRPDKNIDHRRVSNLRVFLRRKGFARPLPTVGDFTEFLPGDLVTCTVPPHLPHVMIVSDKKNDAGVPLIIHNIGGGVHEENALARFPLTGHYRWK